MKKMKEKENLNMVLPHELIVEILLRLPVRSLVRFKSVCTSWLSLISDPQFAESQFDLDTSPTHRLLLKKFNHDSEIESLDLEASLHDDSAVVKLKHPAPNFLFQTLGSCRGLILAKKMGPSPSIGDLIVWNPSTGAHREIPVVYVNWYSSYGPATRFRQEIPYVNFLFEFVHGFGYDPSKDVYLLVVIRLGASNPDAVDYGVGRLVIRMQYDEPKVTKSSGPRMEVLCVDAPICDAPICGTEGKYTDLGLIYGLFLNESLHWLVVSNDTELYVVIAFGLVERRLSEIPLSPDLAAELETCGRCYLRALGGCLSLCYWGGADSDEMVVWVMKEYKVQSSWIKSVVPFACDMDFLPIRFTACGGVFGSDMSGMFKKFNDKGELLENRTYGLYAEYFDMYRESLLTLPNLGDAEENEDA